MFRFALILIVCGVLGWMVIRLLDTVKDITDDEKDDHANFKDRKIIDAEFEDIEEDE